MHTCRLIFVFALLALLNGNLLAQLKAVVTNLDKEPLESVHVFNHSSKAGTVTDKYGRFTIKVEDQDIIQLDHLNFNTKYIHYQKGINLDTIALSFKDYSIDEVNITRTINPQFNISNVSQINLVPSFLGEQDVLKYLATLPGTTSLSMLDAGIYVRGGNSSHNAYLINNIPVADPNHLTGILSTFDPYLLGTSSFYKAGYPSKYNGFLSSYIDMKPSAYHESRFSGELNGGLLSSSLKLKIQPDRSNRSTVGFSMRKSYYQFIADAYNKNNDANIPLYNFNEVTTTVAYKISDKCYANLTVLATNDKLPLKVGDKFSYNLDWNSNSSVLDFSYMANEAMTLNVAMGYNQYFSAFNAESKRDMDGKFKIKQFFSTAYVNHQISNKTEMTYGFSLQQKEYNYYQNYEKDSNNRLKNDIGTLFIEYKKYFSKNISLDLGLNTPIVFKGSPTCYLSPRIKLNYQKDDFSIWLDYSDTRQFEERKTVFTLKSPVDIVIPVDDLEPAVSRQVSLGSSFRPKTGSTFYYSVYYKSLKRVKDFANNSLMTVEEIVPGMIEGKGEAYGIELDYLFKSPSLYARINYTISEVSYRFSELNNGQRFFPPFDIRHNILLNASLRIKKNLNLNALWSYLSGTMVTIPIGVAVAKDIASNSMTFIPVYGNRYNYRLPANHRLDINMEISKPVNRDMLKFNIGAYNLYNKQNASFVFIEPESKDDYLIKFNLRSKVLLPFMPYVSVSYIFNR